MNLINKGMDTATVLKLYEDPKTGLTGLTSFYRSLPDNIKKHYTSDEIKSILEKSRAFTQHRPAVRRYTFRRIVVSGIDDTWSMDIAEMTNSNPRINHQYKYLLACIDNFSKYL